MLATAEFASGLLDWREKKGLTQEQAAIELGVSLRSYQGYERGEGTPPAKKAMAIASQIGMKQASSNNSAAPGHPPERDPIFDIVAGAGPGGSVVREEPIGYIGGADALSRPGRRVGWIQVRGDSMGEMYRRGLMVPVHFYEDPPQRISEDDVYLFRLEDAVQIKRLQRLPGDIIRVISDNPRYQPIDINIAESGDFAILGRVLS